MNKKELIIRHFTAYPQISYCDVADEVGCSESYVRKVERDWLDDGPAEGHQPDMFESVEQIDRGVGPVLTGGSNDYWKARIDHPTSGGEPYIAECNDIIEALHMEYDVANAFKAAWRVAVLRQGRGKPGQESARYDGEKIVFFGQRIIAREGAK